MSLETCYSALEGDYQTVYNRLNKNERIVKKFVLKFLEDPSRKKTIRKLFALPILLRASARI